VKIIYFGKFWEDKELGNWKNFDKKKISENDTKKKKIILSTISFL